MGGMVALSVQVALMVAWKINQRHMDDTRSDRLVGSALRTSHKLEAEMVAEAVDDRLAEYKADEASRFEGWFDERFKVELQPYLTKIDNLTAQIDELVTQVRGLQDKNKRLKEEKNNGGL